MKEFLKKILNGIFPGVPTKTAGWISLAFLIVLIAGIVALCIWAKKTGKKEVEDVNITKEDQQEVTNQTEKVEENTQAEKVEEKAEQTETTKEEPKEEEKEVVMKEEKKTTKQAKATKTEKTTKATAVKEEKAEEKPKAKKTETKTAKAKEVKTETLAEKKPAKVKEEKQEEKQVEETEQAEEVKIKNQKYMVIYDKEKKDWVIKKTGAAKASKRCKTKKEALEFVEKYAENQDLNVSIKKKDGKFQKKY
ncbi:MAG: DUF2188 domain-containing protein [Clostridia bacterium]|nr:DUF2188 domain-containing protein [Clostridia bacterium]